LLEAAPATNHSLPVITTFVITHFTWFLKNDFILFLGFVGQGMLTAAVSGSVFASPPAGHILAAIRAARSSDNG
jgi:hypothetical protein